MLCKWHCVNDLIIAVVIQFCLLNSLHATCENVGCPFYVHTAVLGCYGFPQVLKVSKFRVFRKCPEIGH